MTEMPQRTQLFALQKGFPREVASILLNMRTALILIGNDSQLCKMHIFHRLQLPATITGTAKPFGFATYSVQKQHL